MKNIPINRSRTPESVAHEELTAAMVPGYRYTQDEVCALLSDRSKSAVRDALHALVDKGVIWRDAASHSRVKYSLLEGEQLREAIERKTTLATPPDWMRANLTGYDAQHRAFRDLCMATRK